VGIEMAAAAVHEIANALMAGAIDVVTVQRGIDPRGYLLVSSGGAGPVHAARVAERFSITRVVVPPAAGVVSAAGLLAVDLRADLSRAVLFDGNAIELAQLEQEFRSLEADAVTELGDLGPADFGRSVDLRYRGQAHAITVDVADALTVTRWQETLLRFGEAHQQAFGSHKPRVVEAAQLRVRASRKVQGAPIREAFHALSPVGPVLSAAGGSSPQRRRMRPAWSSEQGRMVDTAVVDRRWSSAGTALNGPAVIESPESTVWVPPGWSAVLQADGSSILDRVGDGPGKSA
jgi:N-methylhydantoinase A